MTLGRQQDSVEQLQTPSLGLACELCRPLCKCSVQMLNNGEVTVRCDPSQVLTGLETTHGGKQDRLGITQHRSALPSALAMIDTIPAGQASACVDKSMLTRTGKMADNQVLAAAQSM